MDLTGLIVACSCERDAPQSLRLGLGSHSGNAEDFHKAVWGLQALELQRSAPQKSHE